MMIVFMKWVIPLRNLGRLKDAIFYYKTALEINPERIDSNHCLGLTFYGLNQYDKGKNILKIF